MLKTILAELRIHAPFTIFGALSGIALMWAFRNMPEAMAHRAFYIFHPLHVVLSALVTSSMYQRYKCHDPRLKCNLFTLLLVGYFGSVGIATLSDSIIPFLGETLLDLPNRRMHLGFIDQWYLINPAAVIGVAIGYFWPSTKFPHSGHVLLSTWASLFHVIMALGVAVYWYAYVVICIFLFIAVWLPCCISDIVFPLLFVGKEDRKKICSHCT